MYIYKAIQKICYNLQLSLYCNKIKLYYNKISNKYNKIYESSLIHECVRTSLIRVYSTYKTQTHYISYYFEHKYIRQIGK